MIQTLQFVVRDFQFGTNSYRLRVSWFEQTKTEEEKEDAACNNDETAMKK